MRWAIQGLLALPVLLASACAHVPAAAPPDHRIKLAVLPAESEAFPAVAEELNGSLRETQVRGVDDRFLSKVPLEVVQLSVECVDATDACYAAVGRALSANWLLLGNVVPLRPHPKSLRVSVTLFDVDAGAAARVVERVFRSASDAERGVRKLVEEVVDAAPASAPASAPPPANPPPPPTPLSASKDAR